jgi:hypothetical protein
MNDGDRSDGDDGAGGDDDGDGQSARTITRMSLRPGGWIGYDDEAVLVAREDGDDDLRIRRDDLLRVSMTPVEWDLVIMSVLLLGVGGYVAATRNPLVGAGFAAVGVWSLYRTYGTRYEVTLRVSGRAKPLAVHPVDASACYETLGDIVAAADAEARAAEGDGDGDGDRGVATGAGANAGAVSSE